MGAVLLTWTVYGSSASTAAGLYGVLGPEASLGGSSLPDGLLTWQPYLRGLGTASPLPGVPKRHAWCAGAGVPGVRTGVREGLES